MALTPEKMEEIVTALSNLTILEVSDLVKKLEEKWGVSAAAPGSEWARLRLRARLRLQRLRLRKKISMSS